MMALDRTTADTPTTPPSGPAVIGVIGAGTMGSGIAELACRAGARTFLFDPFADALARGIARIEADLAKLTSRGKLSVEDARAARERLTAASALDELAACGLVIEAVPESLELKRSLIAELDGIVAPDCVIATNTSSLLVTAIAAGSAAPERVLGMHFFNPPTVMRLLEVVAGTETSERALALADAAGRALGKEVVRALDGPGFLVNRSNRPFSLEALRLLSERVATASEIDRICRMAGGFRMGPLELGDLVGLDTSFEVSRSFFEQSFGEPRWRPSMLLARLVAAGRLGRKSGIGYHDYRDGAHRAEDPPAPAPMPWSRGPVHVTGTWPIARALGSLASAAGIALVDRPADASLVIDCDGSAPASRDTPRLVLCARGTLAALDPSGGAVGFSALPPFGAAALVELTRGRLGGAAVEEAAVAFFAALGKQVSWVGDGPGLVLARIVCQVINEATFALSEGVGTAADIDTGLTLALNHPRGPFAWADAIGVEHVLATLDALYAHHHDDAYRAAPLLRQMASVALRGGAAGRFHPASDSAP